MFTFCKLEDGREMVVFSDNTDEKTMHVFSPEQLEWIDCEEVPYSSIETISLQEIKMKTREIFFDLLYDYYFYNDRIMEIKNDNTVTVVFGKNADVYQPGWIQFRDSCGNYDGIKINLPELLNIYGMTKAENIIWKLANLYNEENNE